jgi:hypothetical protein
MSQSKTKTISSLPTIIEEKEEEDMDLISLITLEYLLNKQQYEKYKQSTTGQKANIRYTKDKKFYRKRIADIVRELCLNENESDKKYNPDIQFAFDQFAKTCIHYFKQVDKRDIIQEDFSAIDLGDNLLSINDSSSIEEIDASHNSMEIDKHMMKKDNKRVTLLNTFVKRIVPKKAPMIVPQQRQICLTNPELKNKGIGKKKNINHNYEENNEK